MPAPAPADTDPGTELLAERLQAFLLHFDGALEGHEDELHQMRVVGRRLRAALPLLAVRPGRRRVRRAIRALRQATRVAGESRDLDVAIELLGRQLGDHPTADQTELRRRLLRARNRAHRRMTIDIQAIDPRRLARDLKRVVRRGAVGAAELEARLLSLQQQRGDTLQHGFAALGGRYDPEALHELRIAARWLRYGAEVADVVRGEATPAASLFKRLQEDMGSVRDSWTLSRWLLARARRIRTEANRNRLAREAARLARLFEADSRERHQDLLDRGAAELAAEALAAMTLG